MIIPGLPSRITDRIRLDPSGCWVWTGACIPDGYGCAYFDGGTRLVHIIVFVALVGPVPAGHELDHVTCSNRPCCNPDHVEPITHRENILRGRSFAAVNARKTHCKNGHPFDEVNTYRTPTQRTCRACNRAVHARRRAKRKATA